MATALTETDPPGTGAALTNLDASKVACLRKMDANTLIALYADPIASGLASTGSSASVAPRFCPCEDGCLVFPFGGVFACFGVKNQARVPLLIGCCADEGTTLRVCADNRGLRWDGDTSSSSPGTSFVCLYLSVCLSLPLSPFLSVCLTLTAPLLLHVCLQRPKLTLFF